MPPRIAGGELSLCSPRVPGSPLGSWRGFPAGKVPIARGNAGGGTTDVHQHVALARGVSAHRGPGGGAVAVLGLAVPAGAVTGTAQISPEQA